MIDDDRAAMDALNSYWDEVVAGTPAQPHALNGGLGAAVRQLHAMDDAPMPDTAFTERLWHELMQSAPRPHVPCGDSACLTGLAAPSRHSPSRRRCSRRSSPPWSASIYGRQLRRR